jgi:hypothetical protein
MTTKTLSKESLELRQPVQAKKPRIVKMAGYTPPMLALRSATLALWICTGEGILMRLQLRVYNGVMNKSMEWFEAKMGALESSGVGEEHSGSGGLMAKFAV